MSKTLRNDAIIASIKEAARPDGEATGTRAEGGNEGTTAEERLHRAAAKVGKMWEWYYKLADALHDAQLVDAATEEMLRDESRAYLMARDASEELYAAAREYAREQKNGE